MTALTDSKSLTLKNDYYNQLRSSHRKYEAWITIEKMVARVQSDLGIIPKEAADAINNEVSINNFSTERYEHHLKTIGHGFYSFVETILENTSELTKKYFHFGLTTQNIQQSAQTLILKDINQEFDRQIKCVQKQLAKLAYQHKDDLIIARTHSKHAMPTTFGFIVSSWLIELTTALEQFQHSCACIEEVMFGGAIGGFNALGEKGLQLQQGVAKALNIRDMPIPSRNIQLPKISYIFGLISVANVLHKIAEAVYNNSTEELSEFTEYRDTTQIGSSTMPHKINPKLSKGIIANSAKLYSLLTPSLYANIKPYESNSASYMILDANINEATDYFNEILIRAVSLTETLQFHKETAYQHIINNGGLDNSEYVMMQLSDAFGKYTAHQIVHDVAMLYQTSKDLSYLECLMKNDMIAQHFSQETVEKWLQPEQYIGLAPELTQRVTKPFL